MNNDDEEFNEKRLQLRQQLKRQLLTLSSQSNRSKTCEYFIPNCRENDFLEQQGLNCVRNYFQIHHFHNNIQLPNICSICRTDSTENWWSFEIDQQQHIVCDQCQQNRMKHSILEQHRQSMKMAFLQAKECERRLEVDYQRKLSNSS